MDEQQSPKPLQAPTAPRPGAAPPPDRAAPPGRLDVSVDDETYEAGSGNIVVMTIRNPFDFPVTILELTEPRSSNLRQSVKQRAPKPNGVTPKPWWMPTVLHDLFGNLVSPALSLSLGFGGVRAEFLPSKPKKLELNVLEGSTVDVGDTIKSFDEVVINAADKSRIISTPPTPEEKETTERVIQPHCETNAFLSIDTRNWLFFKPTRLRLKSEIRYRINSDATEYSQVMSLNFDVRPPLGSVLIGAAAGAFLGKFARFINDIPKSKTDIFNFGLHDWIALIIELGGVIIMAVIATVALSRKTGAQGFITVEDFFGGFVVGVLIAYQGPGYFEDLLSNSTKTGAPKP